MSAAFFGSFRKRTYTVGELVRNLAVVWRRRADVRAIWGGRRLDPAFREQIMVAVAQVNECRYCSFVHQAWASHTGVSNEELTQIEGMNLTDFDRRKWLALAYSRARAEADFGPVAAELAHEFQESFGEQERASGHRFGGFGDDDREPVCQHPRCPAFSLQGGAGQGQPPSRRATDRRVGRGGDPRGHADDDPLPAQLAVDAAA